MQTENIFTAHPTTADQINALIAVVKAFKIKFEVTQEKPYNPEFVAKILQGDEDIKNGRGIKMSVEEFKSQCK